MNVLQLFCGVQAEKSALLISLEENGRLFAWARGNMKKLFDVYVDICDAVSVDGKDHDICMLSFSGRVSGKYFNGAVLGTGVDTQTTAKGGKCFLSARYMLAGTDINGNQCRVFIENNGDWETGFTPRLVTDSTALQIYESAQLEARMGERKNGVIVSIYAPDPVLLP